MVNFQEVLYKGHAAPDQYRDHSRRSNES